MYKKDSLSKFFFKSGQFANKFNFNKVAKKFIFIIIFYDYCLSCNINLTVYVDII
jgi:hypothetical protein